MNRVPRLILFKNRGEFLAVKIIPFSKIVSWVIAAPSLFKLTKAFSSLSILSCLKFKEIKLAITIPAKKIVSVFFILPL